MKGLCVVVMAVVMTGCASIEGAAGKAVHRYCGAVTEGDQQALRDRVDKATDPHQVRINCSRETAE